MKRTLTLILFLAATNLSFGWIWTEVEINKDNLLTIAEMEYLKILMPKEKDYINEAILAARSGADYEYGMEFTVVTATPAKQILRVELVAPDPAKSVYVYTYDGSFSESGDMMYEYCFFKEYFTFDPMKADFPAGYYIVRIIGKNNQVIETEGFTIPEYSESDFLDMPQGQPSWENNVLKLDWSTVAGSDGDEYGVCVSDLKVDDDYWEDDIIAAHPTLVSTLFIADEDNPTVKPGKDYSIEVEASYALAYNVYMDSETGWFVFKKPLPAVKQNKIDKCTVVAGKDDMDSISFSGILDAIEADFILARQQAKNIEVTLESDLMGTLRFPFDITDNPLKKGVYKSSWSAKGGTYSFGFDCKTGKMAFSAKNVDLMGLACPITATIAIGDYEAKFELDEPIVNGAKLCPSALMIGVQNSLDVTKFVPKAGKTTNSDSFTAQGTFSISGQFDFSQPFILTLGGQPFTAPGSAFKWVNGVASCANAPAAEGGLVSAKFDTNTGAFTIAVKNTFIEDYGNAAFDLSLFGILLGGLDTAELGPKTYFNIDELTRQNVPGASWTYNSSYTVSALGEKESGTMTSSVYVQNNLVNLNGHLCTVITSGAGDEEFSMARYMDSDGIHAAQWGTTSQIGGFNAEFSSDFLYAPQYMRIGQSFSDAGTYEGYYDFDDSDIDISDFHGTASTSLKLIGYETITVPYGTYSGVKSQQDLSLSGQMHILVDTYDPWTDEYVYYNKIAKFTATCKQTVWSNENVGALKMIVTMSIRLSLPAMGSVTVTIVQTSDLVSAN